MKKTTLALVLSLVGVAIMLFCPANLGLIGMPLMVVLGIAALVVNKMAKKENENGKNSLAVTIISVVLIVLGSIATLGYVVLNNQTYLDNAICPNEAVIKDCVNNNDGTATCNYAGSEIKCSTDSLKETQYKK